MHSKVIVASLVCMLAASFGAGNKMTSGIKNASRNNEETVCYAPNDDGSNFTFVNDITSVGDEARAVFTCDKTIQSVRVMKTTPGVVVRTVIVGTSVFVYVTPDNTRVNQSVIISFSTGMKKTSTKYTKVFYIYNADGYCSYSTLSASDAKAKYFMNLVATEEQLDELEDGSPVFSGSSSGNHFGGGSDYPYPDDQHPEHPDPWPPIPDPNPPRFSKITGFAGGLIGDEFPVYGFVPTAEQSYTEFVFGDAEDVEYTVSMVKKSSVPAWQQRVGTGLNAYVNWYDADNVAHPAKGASVQFYANGEVLTDYGHIFSQGPMSYDYRTNSNGYCNVDVRSDVRVMYLEARVCADSQSTRVEDNYKIDYPFFVRAMQNYSVMEISDYNEITFTINIYQKESERGQAFAMSQMQNVPFDYCNQFSSGVEAVKTVFPAAKTYYDGENSEIFVQREDCTSWDVLTHEYGHYIADQLGLCYISDERMPHGVFEDLTINHGVDDGKKLAYTEGLATYLGLASQMFYANRFTADDYADEIYQDENRNLEVDYGEWELGNNNYANADGVEARVTSVLMKLMDDEVRYGDDVSLGHQNMFNIISGAASSSATIHNVLNNVVDTFPELVDGVYDIMDIESIPNLTMDAWTILIYASVGSWHEVIYDDINEILSVQNKPDNVNIVIEMGGYGNILPPANYPISPTNIGRYHVENQQLIRDESLPDANMGEEETFNSFVEWGLTEFPARKTGVILWGPGDGMNGVCADKDFAYADADLLNMNEVWWSFADHLYDARFTSLEFIGYDSNFMQIQDIADYNSDFFKYMIASQSGKTPTSWAYDDMLERIYDYQNNDTLDILLAVSDSYYQDSIANEYPDAAMSILDLSKMYEYRVKFETLINTIHDIIFESSSNIAEFAAILCGPGTRKFNGGDSIDAYTFLRQLSYSSTYAAYYYQIIDVMEGYEEVILENKQAYLNNDAHGLSLQMATEGYNITTRFSHWRDLMFFN